MNAMLTLSLAPLRLPVKIAEVKAAAPAALRKSLRPEEGCAMPLVVTGFSERGVRSWRLFCATLEYDRACAFRGWTLGGLGGRGVGRVARALPSRFDRGDVGGSVERVGDRRGMHSGGTGANVARPGDGQGDALRTARHR